MKESQETKVHLKTHTQTNNGYLLYISRQKEEKKFIE